MAKKDLTTEQDFLNPEAKSGIGKAVRQSKVFKDAMKKIREGLRKILQKVGQLLAKALANPYVLIVLAIIIVILLFISFIQAFLNVPGDMQARLKAFFDKAFEGWHFATGAEVKLSDDYEDIIGVVNYLEDMEYDVISYGFVKPSLNTEKKYTMDELMGLGYQFNTYEGMKEQGFTYSNTDDLYHLFNMETGEIYSENNGHYYNGLGIEIDNYSNERVTAEVDGKETYTDTFGMIRSTEEFNENGKGKLLKISSKKEARYNYGLIRTYLLSDYRIYSLRNYDEAIMSKIYEAMDATFGGNQDAWSKGLISLYESENSLATGNWTTWDRLYGGDSAHITRDSLELKDGYFNKSMKYEIEGWAPRYGLSLEFLLSLHLGTMAPDLVYAVLQNFDTEIQVYLNDSGESKVNARYIDPEDRDADAPRAVPDGTSIQLVKDELDDGGYWLSAMGVNDAALTQWINPVFLTRKVCQYLLLDENISMESPWNCTGTATSYILVAATGGEREIGNPSAWDTIKGWFSSDEQDDVAAMMEQQDQDFLSILYGYDSQADAELMNVDYRDVLDPERDEEDDYNHRTALISMRVEDYGYGNYAVADNPMAMDSSAYTDVVGIRDSSDGVKQKAKDELGLTVDKIESKTTPFEDLVKNGNSYRIEKIAESAEWDVYYDKNGNMVSQADYEADSDNNDETTAYYDSLIYKVYQTGIVDASGNITKYGETNEEPQESSPYGKEIDSFRMAMQYDYNLVDDPGATSTKQDMIVKFYYDENMTELRAARDFPSYQYNEELSHIRVVLEKYDGSTEEMTITPDVEALAESEYSFFKYNYRDSSYDSLMISVDYNQNGKRDYNITISYDENSEAFRVRLMEPNTDSDFHNGYVYTGTTGDGYGSSANVVNDQAIAEFTESLSNIRRAIDEGTTVIQGEFLIDVLYLNVTLRDKTEQELIDCGILEYDEATDTYVWNVDGGKCSENEDQKKCCRNCQKYVKKVVGALAEVSDQNYKFYTPYIARVVGSWFRNTYFIIPESSDVAIDKYYEKHKDYNKEEAYGNNVSFVKVDQEYLADSGEYWTAYEMKADPDNPGLESNEYQLYVLKPNGLTSDTTMESFLSNGLIDGVQASVNGRTVTGYDSQKDAEKDGWAFVKKAQKMSISEVIADSTASSAYPAGVLWSAYVHDSEGRTRDWERVLYSEDNKKVNAIYDIIYHINPGEGGADNTGEAVENTGIDTSRANDDNEPSGVFYEMVQTNNITQEEDAQRVETNPLIKYLFKYRQFYIYDGTERTALAIEHDKYRVLYGYEKYMADGLDPTEEFYSNKKLVKEQYKELETTGYSDISKDGEFYHYKGLLGSDGLLKEYYGGDWKSNVTDYLNNYGRSAIRDSYNWATLKVDEEDLANQWLDWQLDMFYMDKYGVDLKEYYHTSTDLLKINVDPRDPDLVSIVSIEKSSLNSFSILENVGTLDAEYQYRDFKELIVELNYFDKEDLSEKIPEIYTWVIPEEAPPSGWPILPVDKQDVDYGTLIHSNQTYLDLGITFATADSSSSGGGYSDGNATPEQIALADSIRELYNRQENFGLNPGFCAGWVQRAYNSVGITVDYKGFGCCAGHNAYITMGGDDLHNMDPETDPIPIGCAVFSGVEYDCGLTPGCDSTGGVTRNWQHVGIYVGNGEIVNWGKEVLLTTVENWITYYHGIRYGWLPGTDVTNGASGHNAGDTGGINPSEPPATSTSTVAEDKIFWIGDSWIMQLGIDDAISENRSEGGTLSDINNVGGLGYLTKNYFYGVGGGNAKDVVRTDLKNQMEGLSDISAVAVGFGLNGTSEDGGTQALIEAIHEWFPSLPIYVIKTSHVGTKYSYMDKDTLNEMVDGYNDRMKAWCEGKDYCKFIDNATNGILDENGYLKETDNEGLHMQGGSETKKTWYNNIVSAISNGRSGSTYVVTGFSGYKNDENVVSPVTGKVLEYGIHTRKNYLTEEDQEVGYIIIEVMSDEYFGSQNGKIDIPSDVEYESNVDEDYDKKEDYDTPEEALNLFYKEYEKVCAGYRIMIDGFNVDLSQEGGEYAQNEVAVLYNTKEQAKREAIEQAKEDAPFIVNLTGNSNLPTAEEGYKLEDENSTQAIYIKEGKYIGKTVAEEKEDDEAEAETQIPAEVPGEGGYTQEDIERLERGEQLGNYTGTADYMRIILKNLDYSIEEEVEKYFYRPEPGVGSQEVAHTTDATMLEKFTCAFENGALYEYLYGDAPYSGYYVVNYITEDKKYFICRGDHLDDDTNRNFGFGVCHHSYGRYMQVEYYEQVGVDIDGGAYYDEGTLLEVEKVEAVRHLIMEDMRSTVSAYFGDSLWNSLSTNKQDVILDFAYQYGPAGSPVSWFKQTLSAGGDGNDCPYFNKWGARGPAREKLWKEGIYTDASGNEIK